MAGCRPLPALAAGLLVVALGSAGAGCSRSAEAAQLPSPAASPDGGLRAQVPGHPARSGPLSGLATAEALGPQLPQTLATLAEDPHAALPMRLQAVAALGAQPAPEVEGHLERLATAAALPTEVRTAAAEALGQRAGDAPLAVLERLLGDARPQVRCAAAHALGTLGSAEARALLEKAVSAEQDAAVREALQQNLTRMQL